MNKSVIDYIDRIILLESAGGEISSLQSQILDIINGSEEPLDIAQIENKWHDNNEDTVANKMVIDTMIEKIIKDLYENDRITWNEETGKFWRKIDIAGKNEEINDGEV